MEFLHSLEGAQLPAFLLVALLGGGAVLTLIVCLILGTVQSCLTRRQRSRLRSWLR